MSIELVSPKFKNIPLVLQDADLSLVIPSGWGIDIVVFENTTVNQAILSGGITPGGSELWVDTPVEGSATNGGYTTIGANFVPDISAPYTLYIHGAWNAAICNIYVLLKKIK